MLCQFDLNNYWNEHVLPRKQVAQSKLRNVVAILGDLLHDVEQHEPRFVGGLNEIDGRIEGVHFLAPNEIEVRLYLNQMGVFNLVDDGTLPGCAALKLRFVKLS